MREYDEVTMVSFSHGKTFVPWQWSDREAAFICKPYTALGENIVAQRLDNKDGWKALAVMNNISWSQHSPCSLCSIPKNRSIKESSKCHLRSRIYAVSYEILDKCDRKTQLWNLVTSLLNHVTSDTTPRLHVSLPAHIRIILSFQDKDEQNAYLIWKIKNKQSELF